MEVNSIFVCEGETILFVASVERRASLRLCFDLLSVFAPGKVFEERQQSKGESSPPGRDGEEERGGNWTSQTSRSELTQTKPVRLDEATDQIREDGQGLCAAVDRARMEKRLDRLF